MAQLLRTVGRWTAGRRTGSTGSAIALVGVGVGLLGCGHDTTGPALRDPAALPWAVALNARAITLTTTPGANTVQLVPTLRTVTGTPLAGASVQYTSTDPSSAAVDTTGLVTARGATNKVFIVATATLGGVSATDTAVVRVNDPSVAGTPPVSPTHLVLQATENRFQGYLQPTPPPGEPLLIDCQAPDIPAFYRFRDVRFTPQVLAADGTDLASTVVVDYHSSDTTLVAVAGPTHTVNPRPGILSPVCAGGRTGQVWITASALVYGVPVRDSVQINVVPALATLVSVLQRTPAATGRPVNYFDPGTVTIGAGGVVVWLLDTKNLPQARADTIDVVFDQPPGPVQGVDTTVLAGSFRDNFPYRVEPAGGNIAPFAPDTIAYHPFLGDDTLGVRVRQFPVPGTYRYHSQRYGTTGMILVRPWPGHGE